MLCRDCIAKLFYRVPIEIILPHSKTLNPSKLKGAEYGLGQSTLRSLAFAFALVNSRRSQRWKAAGV